MANEASDMKLLGHEFAQRQHPALKRTSDVARQMPCVTDAKPIPNTASTSSHAANAIADNTGSMSPTEIRRSLQ
jgi:hypothetical protein